MTPTVVRTRAELAAAREPLAAPVGVVMTMGALHAGHARLMQVAREQSASVVATIFVNPLQFGAGEDLDRYPRTFDADVDICTREGVDVVFAPTPDVVYPGGDPAVRVAAGALGERLEGAHRPGHFDGVLTVVAKLLHLTRPDLAFFGEKDAQQLALIRQMVRDLDFPVTVVGVPTVRADSGLALSSRNEYLSDSDRCAADSLYKALAAGSAAAADGAQAVVAAAQAVLDAQPTVSVDYLALVDDESWADAGAATRAARLLVAARVGSTRLIDNVPIVLGTTTASAPRVG
jgi:pantoate--beta-alanine ligase